MSEEASTLADLNGLLSTLGVSSVEEAQGFAQQLKDAEGTARFLQRDMAKAKNLSRQWHQEAQRAKKELADWVNSWSQSLVKAGFSKNVCDQTKLVNQYLDLKAKVGSESYETLRKERDEAIKDCERAELKAAHQFKEATRIRATNKQVRSERNRAFKALSIIKDIQFDRLTKDEDDEKPQI